MSSQKELIPMRPGDLLRYRREQSGLTLERAAELSRIKPQILAAIESGETSAIPSVYLRGYLRNYARCLGVDQAEIEEHMSEVRGAEPEMQSVFSVPTKRGRSEKWIKASSYVAASLIIAALAWQFTHEAVRFSQGESQLTGQSAAAPAPGSSGGEDGSSPSRPANTHLSASIASVEMMQQSPAKNSKVAAEQAWAAIAGQEESAAAEAGVHRLAVTTSADSWVEIVDATGAQLELDLIRAGSQREYAGRAPFAVMIGRPAAVELLMDGEAVDLAPHIRGSVARLTLGEESLVSSSESAESLNR